MFKLLKEWIRSVDLRYRPYRFVGETYSREYWGDKVIKITILIKTYPTGNGISNETLLEMAEAFSACREVEIGNCPPLLSRDGGYEKFLTFAFKDPKKAMLFKLAHG